MKQADDQKAILKHQDLESIAGGYNFMDEEVRRMKEQARWDNEAIAAELEAAAAAEAAANAPPVAPKPDYGRYSGGRNSN